MFIHPSIQRCAREPQFLGRMADIVLMLSQGLLYSVLFHATQIEITGIF
jgi:hypothetical protein